MTDGRLFSSSSSSSSRISRKPLLNQNATASRVIQSRDHRPKGVATFCCIFWKKKRSTVSRSSLSTQSTDRVTVSSNGNGVESGTGSSESVGDVAARTASSFRGGLWLLCHSSEANVGRKIVGQEVALRFRSIRGTPGGEMVP